MEEILAIISAVSNDSIQFEETGRAYHPEGCVEYLDLEIYIENCEEGENNNQILQTKVFDKPTNLHIYTDPTTFYPFHYIYNWIQGENIRLIRNSSKKEDYEKTLSLFKEFLLRRNYCDKLIDNFVELNYFEDRDDLLNGRKPHEQRKPKDKRLDNHRPVIVYNDGCRPFITRTNGILNHLFDALVVTDTKIDSVVSKGKSIGGILSKIRRDFKDASSSR